MDFIRRNARRIAIDAAGYLLIVLAILTGWLPGPGGIPLAVAGLGLLSVNNAWAKRLRKRVLQNSGRAMHILFPRNPWVEWGYDVLVLALFGAIAWLAVKHSAFWQISASITAFFVALFIALTNRDRLNRLRGKHRR